MFRSCLVLTMILMVTHYCFSQDADIEGVRNNLAIAEEIRHDSLHYELAKLFRKSNQDSALVHLRKAYALSVKYDHPGIAENACFGLQVIYSRLDEQDSMYLYLKRGLTYAERNGSLGRKVIFHNNLGLYFKDRYLYDSALAHYFWSLEVATEASMHSDRVVSLNNLGTIYYRLGNVEEAERFFSTSLEIIEKENVQKLAALSTLNLAVTYVDQQKFTEAISLLGKLETICEMEDCQDELRAKLYYNLGYSYFEQKEIDQAEKAILASYKYSSSQFPELNGRVTELYGTILFEKGATEKVDSLLTASLAIANATNDMILKKRVYERLSLYHEKTGNTSESLYFYKLFSSVKDSLFNETIAKNIRDIHLDVKQREAQAIISEKDSELERSRIVNLLVAAVAILSAIIIFLMLWSLSLNRKAKAELEQQVQKRTLDLQRRNEELAASHKQYDHLIYRTSHDIRGPISTLLGLTYLAQLELKNNLSKEDTQKYLRDIEQTARGLSNTLSKFLIIDKVRNQEILHEELQVKPFFQSIVQQHMKKEENKCVDFRLDVAEDCRVLVTDKFLLEIIISSLLDNSFFYRAREGKGPQIILKLINDGGQAVISVTDNGPGIEVHAIPLIFDLFYVASEKHGSGLGLFLALTAANRLQGQISVESGSDPTIFKVVLPLQR